MGKIIDLTSEVLRVPTGKHITDSIHSTDIIEFVTCKILTDTGMEGIGFTYTIGNGGYSIKAFIDHYIREALIGDDYGNITEIWNKLWWITQPVGRGGITTHVIAAIDIALWDLKGKEVGKPLQWLLGGSSKPVKLYETNSGWLHYSQDELVESAKNVIKTGFYGFKIKLGKKNPEEDISRIKAVMDVTAGKIALMTDVNQAWSYNYALRMSRIMEKMGVYWIEEPFPADDIVSYKKLSRHSGIPVASGETIFTKYEFQKYLDSGSISISQHDVCRVGGITEWMQISSLCASNNVMVSPHFVMQLHAPLVSSISNGMYVEYIPWMENVFEDQPRVENGLIYPSNKPGIGLRFNEKFLEANRIG